MIYDVYAPETFIKGLNKKCFQWRLLSFYHIDSYHTDVLYKCSFFS